MRHLFTIIMTVLCLSLYAADYAPLALPFQEPQNPMQSVNNTSYMSSGSAYSSAVYEVGAYSPSAFHKPARGLRSTTTGLPGKDNSEYDPNNPQFAPLTDTLIPLFLFAMGYLMYILYRKRQEKKRNIRIT